MDDDILTEKREKILVADDEQDLREALFTILAAQGYEVITAEDGETALELALSEHPDLILLDLNMPKMKGGEVLEALRKDEWGEHAKVVVLTAYGDMDTLSKIMETGGLDYLVKSDWKLEDIVRMVGEKLTR
jgi:CheY-like chemotaxis protein